MDDPRPLLLDALDLADTLVAGVTDADLARPTPCAGWDLAALLAHVVGQYHGFARALVTGDAPAAALAPVAFTAASWSRAVAELRTAVGDLDLDGTARVEELAPSPLPVRSVLRAQLLDTVVHTWDVASALGLPFEPPRELVDEVAAIAETIPPSSSGPGRAFAAALSPTGSTWQRTLARVGRDTRETPTGAGASGGSDGAAA